jgi:hypothetical protein
MNIINLHKKNINNYSIEISLNEIFVMTKNEYITSFRY